MVRSLYTSGWSMLANSKKLDIISNNLANVNTNAYKRDTVVFESFPSLLAKRINDVRSQTNPSGNLGSVQYGSDIGEIYTNYAVGQLMNTGNKLDLAIQNSESAFFTIAVPDKNGNPRLLYTRDGSFTLDSKKQLVTKEGYAVMGENGPIMLEGENINVREDGVIVQNGKEVTKLLLKNFKNPDSLRKFGSNLIEITDQTVEQDFQGTVAQGYLEQSNVNIIREMVDMISIMRSYEANQKIIQTIDGTLDRAVNEVGALR